MQGGSTFKIASKTAITVALLFQMYVKSEGSAISVAQCEAQHREVADSDSPCNPIVTGRHGDAAAPRWQCRRWWTMPCWTSLRGASHNRSFQKALLHTAAWGTAWKVISINSQPSSSAISKHNLELRNIIVFLPLLCSTQCDDELAEWWSFDEYDTAVMIVWTWSLLGGIEFGWKDALLKQKNSFFHLPHIGVSLVNEYFFCYGFWMKVVATILRPGKSSAPHETN